MRVVFGSWKYVFKNIWYLLPFAVIPAVFLSLTLNYSAVAHFTHNFFTGQPRMGFLEFFYTFSFLRVDSWLGGVYTVCAFFTTAVASALLLSMVEKHMRIGKRSLSGVFTQFRIVLFSGVLLTLVYLVLYETWVVLLAAVLFVISQVKVTALVYILGLIAFFLLSYALFFVVAVFYLWLPCRLMTGFGPYNAFLYSYRLMTGVRWKLLLGFAVGYAPACVALAGLSLLPALVFRIVAVLLYILILTDFLVRMEVVYFETDRLDREDELHSYRGYWR